MGCAGPGWHVFWRAMRGNVPGREGLVKDLGCAVPTQEKKIGGLARPIMSCRASGSCQWAVLVGHANGPC